MSTLNSSKYLSRWMNARISLGLKLSLLIASHICHWWLFWHVIFLAESIWVSSAACQPFLPLTGLLPVTLQAVPSTSATGEGPSASLSQGNCLGLFFWRSAVLPGSCMISTGYRSLTKRLNQTLAWHSFNCPTGQGRVLPASAAAHLTALKCCSGSKEF